MRSGGIQDAFLKVKPEGFANILDSKWEEKREADESKVLT